MTQIRLSLTALLLLLFSAALPAEDETAATSQSAANAATPATNQTEPQNSSAKSASDSSPEKLKLHPMEATYKATLEKGIPFDGTAYRTLKPNEDGTWFYAFRVRSWVADINETLTFRWDGHQVIPQEYNYELTGWLIRDRTANLQFDWDKKRVRNDVKGDPWFMDIHEGVLDKLGFQLQLREDLRAGKKHMVYQIADGGKLKEYEFAVIGEEELDTREHGKVNTIVVEKVREPYKKRKTHLWLAPDWNYLLVRMLQIEKDGTRYEIYLDEAKFPDRVIK
ncbi:DUF3108 domain-containing protein [Marinobacteraceae bacterium S3BR75-40.1]